MSEVPMRHSAELKAAAMAQWLADNGFEGQHVVKVLVLGDSGAGTSFVCNALIGADVFEKRTQAVRAMAANTFVAAVLGDAAYVICNIPGLIEADQHNVPRNKAAIEAVFEFQRGCPTLALFVASPTGLRVKNEDYQAIHAMQRHVNLDPRATTFLVNGVEWDDIDDEAAYRAAVEQQVRQIVHPSMRTAFTAKLSRKQRTDFECAAMKAFQLTIARRLTDSHREERRRAWKASEGRLREFGVFSDASGWGNEQNYSTMRPIVIGRCLYAVARGAGGLCVRWLSLDTSQRGQVPGTGSFADAGGWAAPQYYKTWQVAAVADRFIVVAARGVTGVCVRLLDTGKLPNADWQAVANVPYFADSAGWNQPQYYSTLKLVVIGTSWLVVVARGRAGLLPYVAPAALLATPDKLQWRACPAVPTLTDSGGWAARQYYSTIRFAAGNDGRSLVYVARGAYVVHAGRIDLATGANHTLPSVDAFADNAGWAAPQYHETVQFVAVSATSFILMMRGPEGITGYRLEVSKDDLTSMDAMWTPLPSLGAYTDGEGWAAAKHYRAMRLVHRPACGDVVLVGRAAVGPLTHIFDLKHNAWREMQAPVKTFFGDDRGFTKASCYETCHVAVDGADVFMCGRSAATGYHSLLLNDPL